MLAYMIGEWMCVLVRASSHCPNVCNQSCGQLLWSRTRTEYTCSVIIAALTNVHIHTLDTDTDSYKLLCVYYMLLVVLQIELSYWGSLHAWQAAINPLANRFALVAPPSWMPPLPSVPPTRDDDAPLDGILRSASVSIRRACTPTYPVRTYYSFRCA